MAAQGTAEGEKLLRQELRPHGPGEPTIEFPRTRFPGVRVLHYLQVGTVLALCGYGT